MAKTNGVQHAKSGTESEMAVRSVGVRVSLIRSTVLITARQAVLKASHGNYGGRTAIVSDYHDGSADDSKMDLVVAEHGQRSSPHQTVLERVIDANEPKHALIRIFRLTALLRQNIAKPFIHGDV